MNTQRLLLGLCIGMSVALGARITARYGQPVMSTSAPAHGYTVLVASIGVYAMNR